MPPASAALGGDVHRSGRVDNFPALRLRFSTDDQSKGLCFQLHLAEYLNILTDDKQSTPL
jgi:hypothetical protein